MERLRHDLHDGSRSEKRPRHVIYRDGNISERIRDGAPPAFDALFRHSSKNTMRKSRYPRTRYSLTVLWARRVGSGMRCRRTQARTMATDSSSMMRCPGDTNMGFTRSLVRSAAPIISSGFLGSYIYESEPASRAGSS